MKTDLQLFNFNSEGVRVIRDANGAPWFHGKDVCDVLGYANSRDALNNLDPDDRNTVAVRDGKRGNPNQTFVNESGLYALIFGSQKPEAKAFKRWVTSEVLPALRKTGRYVLADYLQPQPRTWSRLYPDLYFKEVLRLYGMEYQPGTNPPQFVGHFTNAYVYGALDTQLPGTLKRLRDECATLEEQKSLMHQFLNGEGRDVLEKHLDRVVTLMQASPTIDQFRQLWERVIVRPNQLELYLR